MIFLKFVAAFLLVAVCAFLLITMVVVILFGSLWRKNNKELESDELIVEGAKSANTRHLVLYQPSKHGSADDIAKRVIDALATKENTIVSNYLSPKVDINQDEFETITMISPVYAGKVSKNLMKVCKKNNFKGKKIYLISSGMAMNDTRELKEAYEYLSDSNTVIKQKIAPGNIEKLKPYVVTNY